MTRNAIGERFAEEFKRSFNLSFLERTISCSKRKGFIRTRYDWEMMQQLIYQWWLKTIHDIYQVDLQVKHRQPYLIIPEDALLIIDESRLGSSNWRDV